MWLKQFFTFRNANASSAAAQKGHLDGLLSIDFANSFIEVVLNATVIVWLFHNGYPFSHRAIVNSASGGYLGTKPKLRLHLLNI